MTGHAPGQWELKTKARRALYLAPKAYALDADPPTVALKGFPAGHASWDTLARAWELEHRVDEDFGLTGFLTLLGQRQGHYDGTALVRRLKRTLTAHPGAGKSRLAGDRVWYTH